MMNKKGNVMSYDQRHGGPYDRGIADSYYGREINPHFFVGATHMSEKIVPEPGTQAYREYMAGYEHNEKYGDKKSWV